MKKSLCLFSRGFAHNRQVRIKFYEKIFPPEVEMHLFTTNKNNDQNLWKLERAKIHVEKYSPFNILFKLRKYCVDNKIEKIMNLGYFSSSILLFMVYVLSDTKFIINRFADLTFKVKNIKDIFFNLYRVFIFIFLGIFAEKITIVDKNETNYWKNKLNFFINEKKIIYLPAPVDTKLFLPKDKNKTRKKLNLPQNKDIILYVGRVYREKGSDILKEIIKKNPNTLFIIIGKIIEDFENFSSQNLIHFSQKSQEELVDYYNAADLLFFLHRVRGGGVGIALEEALSVGTPVISPERKGIKKTPAIIQIPIETESVNKEIKKFFSLSPPKRKKLSKKAREYVNKHYSYNALKEKYNKVYIK